MSRITVVMWLVFQVPSVAYAQAREVSEEKFEPNHPAVGASLNNLAELYRVQGRYAEAQGLYRRDLAIQEKALGPEHPRVAAVLENYAILVRKTGRSVEADKLEERSSQIRGKEQ